MKRILLTTCAIICTIAVFAQDLSINGTNQTPIYYSTPITQVQGITFSADVALDNVMNVTQPSVAIEIFKGLTSVYINTPSQALQVAGTVNTYTAGSAYSPIGVDNYMVTFDASAIEADPNLLNNQDTTYFVVSDSVYARDNGNYDGALSIGSGSAGFLGNMYQVITADDLTSITFTLTTPTIGDTVVGQIYNMLAGVPNQLIASTDTLFVTNAAAAEYTLSVIGGSVNLAPGNYVVGLLESVSNGVTIATTTEYYIPGTSWVYFNSAWGNNENFGFLNAFVARANFGIVCLTPVASYTNSSVGLAVNYADASTTLGTVSYLWDFGDGNTSTMQNPSHTYATGGAYTVCLTVTDDCGSDNTCSTVNVSNLGIEENQFDLISIFPVPANDNLIIGNLKTNQDYVIELVNALGQVVSVHTVRESSELNIELSSLAHGVYQVRITSNDEVGIKPILIIRQ